MNRILEYKGYHAKIEFDAEDMLMVGEVFGIRDSLNFHGKSIAEIVEAFHQSIDNYLDLCAELKKTPDKEYKGSFNVRIAPDLHRDAAFAADRKGITLNQFVETAIRNAILNTESTHTYFVSPLFEPAVLNMFQNYSATKKNSNYSLTTAQY